MHDENNKTLCMMHVSYVHILYDMCMCVCMYVCTYYVLVIMNTNDCVDWNIVS